MPVLGTSEVAVSPAAPSPMTTGAAANAYITIANYAWWVGATPGVSMPVKADGTVDTDTLSRAIVTATRLIDSFFDWTGSRASDDQNLDWPRVDVDGAPSESVPTEIALATCAQTAFLLSDDSPSWYGPGPARQPASVRAGAVAVTYSDDDGAGVQPVSPAAIAAIPSGWYRGGAAGGVAIVQGVQV